MKRYVLALVAFLALLTSTTQPVRADWVIDIDKFGWFHLRWDPAFDDGDFDPPPPPKPDPLNPNQLIFIMYYFNGIWFGFYP